LSRKRKRLVWILGALGAFLCLLLALLVLAPKLINLEPIREKVLASFSEKLGGQVEYKGIDLSILPRPRLVLHKGSLSIPGQITGTLESLAIYPQVLPLLKGQVRISKIQAVAPDFKMILPQRPENDEKGEDGFSPALIEKKVAPILAVMVLKAPGLVIQVEKGRLNLSEGNSPWLSFQDIDARIGLPPDTLNLEITCKSNLWEGISFKGSLDAEDFKGKGRIDLTRLRPEGLTRTFFPQAPLNITDSQMDLSLAFNIDGLKTLKGEFVASIPYLNLHRAKRKLQIKGGSLKGSFHMDEGKITVSLKGLQLEDPRLEMTGQLLMDQGSQRVSLELKGKDVDIRSTREAVLAIAGDIPIAQEIFSIVKGGQLPLITLNMEGSSLAELGELENTLIKGRIIDGQISVPETGLDLEDVKGEVVISRGILEGKGLEARLGRTQGSQGILKLGLVGDPSPFHLDIVLKADLSEIPSILKRLVDNKSMVKEIDLIEELKGHATARVILGESTASIKACVSVSELGLSAKYGRVPYPLEVTGGQLSFEGANISVRDFAGKLGNSGFSQLSGGFDWGREPYLEVKSGDFDLSLGEIYSWVSSLKGVGSRLKDLKSVKGRLALSAINLKGPISSPQNWRFKVTGEVNGLSVNTALFDGPAQLTRARFDATEKSLSFKDAHINLLDVSLNVSGGLNDYIKDLRRVDIKFDGDVGPEALRRLSGFVNMPSHLDLRSPLSISKAQFVWEKGGMVAFNGNLDVREGPRVSMDIVYKNGNLAIKNLSIEDKDSSAVMEFDLNQKEVGLKFSGHLKKETLDHFLSETRFPSGSVKGDFQARFERDNPMNFVATGKLEGTDIELPWKVGAPLKVQRFSLFAEENMFSLEPAIIEWGDTRLVFEGKIGFDEGKIRLDMDLTADGLDAEKLAAIARTEEKEGVSGEGKSSWDLPLRGELRVKSDYLKYQKFVWRPLHVDISFEPDGIAASVIKANLCGISMPGTLKVSDKGLQLDFRPVSENKELNPTIVCLSDKSIKMDGTFDFKGGVKGKGAGKGLPRSLRGSFECVAKDGRIYQAKVLSKILAILNLTEIFRGKLPDLGKEGLAYNSITVKGRLADGKLLLKEMAMDGTTMNLAGHGDIDLLDKKVNLIILASFLKTVDSIVRMIPLVRYILDGTLISVPIKVSGDLADPDVQYVPASAVGSGLLGMIKRTLKLPIKIIEPILPKEKEPQVSPQN